MNIEIRDPEGHEKRMAGVQHVLVFSFGESTTQSFSMHLKDGELATLVGLARQRLHF